MNTLSDVSRRIGDRLLAVVCDIRGHDWAGARQHAAQADGLLLCVRCGHEDRTRTGATRGPLLRLHDA